jgi:hypothetical protein
MKQYRMLFIFIALMLAVSLACNGGSAPAEPTPTNAPSVPNPPSNNGNPPANPPANNGNTGNGSELVTFIDQNNLMAFELPADWTYENGSDTNYYYDTFTSPDETAKMESLVYNDGDPFVAGQNGKFALGLLHNIYSNTGKEGDIRVTDDSIQSDGSERLTWESKSGGYSGVSFFELRGDGNRTFLMLTAWWSNDTDQANIDAINAAIASYRLP